MSTLASPERLAALRATGLLDTAPEAAFDRLARLTARALRAPVAVVSLVDDRRQFFMSCAGALPEPWHSARGTPLSHSLCRLVVEGAAPLVVGDARRNPDARGNLAVPELGVVAYLGVPLVDGDGHVLGALAAIDGDARDWDDDDVATMRDLAACVMAEVRTRGRVAGGARERLGRRTAAAARRAAERHLRGILDSAREGVWFVDAHGRTRDANPALLALLGVGADELRGRPLLDWVAGGTAEAAAHLARLRTGHGGAFPIAFRHRDGQAVECLAVATPLHDDEGRFAGATLLLYDQRARRSEEEAERAAHAQALTLLRHLPDPAWHVDPDGRLVTVNDAYLRLLGRPASDVVGRLESELWPSPTRERFAANLRAVVQEGREVRARSEVTLPDGRVRRYESVMLPIRGRDGAPTGAVGISRDVTDSDLAEERLRHAHKMEALGRLAGGVAHDFNNLLTVIKGEVPFVREVIPPGDEALEDLAAIDAAADRAAALTRQLLAFSRQQVLRPRRLSVSEVVADVERMLQRVIGADVALSASLDASLWPVHADPGQLEQVLMNLAINARDAMPSGGELTLRTRNVGEAESRALAAGRQWLRAGEFVALEVGDSGVGMDAVTLSRIFEPFFTTKPAGRGTGLGLATVYGIVKQSGGYVYADSAPGRGTRVTVLLPRALPEAGDADTGEHEVPTTPTGSETVLVVEDDPAVRVTVIRMLTGGGYRVLEARNGIEALATLERRVAEIDLLLTDVVMPGLGARDLLGEVRARWVSLPALVMSGYSPDVVETQGALAAGVPLLSKPFSRETLLRQVRAVLDAAAAG
ncbi:PAS domain-containing protein [Roseisolibacter sp. H3M3-2]|uniref:PAS domain-containing protein n=1 Tax=Roseisolibacter sp. H3M3-2 TaxID=3031323 RepID=UPI0023D9DBB8|nr:PAS domain-containing protein [Roseisolibacter sp. H3M3-2]MDF1504716.1 PAS domain-containing protein [Roseisolibacter sp. H3M3-2]